MSNSGSRASINILLSNIVSKALNLIALFFCTPFLGPNGFGNLLVVGIFLALFTIILDIGFEHYYLVKIQLSGNLAEDNSKLFLTEQVVFRIRLISNFFLCLLQIAVSFILVDVFFVYPVDILLRILSLNYIFGAIGRINEVRLKKRLDFYSLSKAKILAEFIGMITKIFLVAFLHLGLIGWVIGLVVSTAINSFYLLFISRFRPVWVNIPKSLFLDVWKFAQHSWYIGIGLYIQQQMSSIILKASFPLQSIGYFQFAHNYSLDLQSGITSPQGQMLIPFISNNRNDRGKINTALHKLSGAFLLLLGPFMIYGLVFTKEIIHILFGSNWDASVEIIKVFLIYGLLKLIYSPGLSLLPGFGLMKLSSRLTYLGAFISLCFLLLCWIFKVSILEYSVVYCCLMCFSDLLKVTLGFKFTSLSFVSYFVNTIKNFVGLVVLLLFCLFLKLLSLSPLQMSSLALMILGLVFVFMYYVSLWLRKDRMVIDLSNLLLKRFHS